jgi:DNA replication protein
MPDRKSSGARETAGFVYLPDAFFAKVMPGIQDLAELKIILYVAYLSAQKQNAAGGGISGVTYPELKAETGRLPSGWGEEVLRRALDSAVEQGALLRSTLDVEGQAQEVYSLAGPLQRGDHVPIANIFVLYEQNIGMLTPMIAEELEEAARVYPPSWIEDAFKEAVTLNKRSWRYIARILERWAGEGKDSGEHKRDTEKNGPDKYVKGKYGHLVRR